MTTLNISDYCDAEEVIAWDLAAVDTVRLTRGAKFESGAQGIALAKLAGLQSKQLEIRCEFNEPITSEEFESTVLGTPFGVSVIRHAHKLVFGQNKDTASNRFPASLTSFYKDRRGLLGKGQACALVCVDPAFRIAPRLMDFAKSPSRSFPVEPSGFTALLKTMTSLLGFKSFLSSTTEASLNSFLYECFVNSQEHGISSASYIGHHSVRALIVEKVVIDKAGLSPRISDDLRAYIERSSEAAGNKLGLGVVCLTVSDQGDGIQATLPGKGTSENEEERFARAFRPGESRKAQGSVKRGLGLDSVLSAAHQMKARISIQSGALRYVQDFSFGEQKYPHIDTSAIVKIEPASQCGTSISIWVPEYEEGLDQPDLFDRKRLSKGA